MTWHDIALAHGYVVFIGLLGVFVFCLVVFAFLAISAWFTDPR